MNRRFLLPLLMFVGSRLHGQHIDTLHNPFRRAANTRAEKLYFVPSAGTVETQTGKVILGPGLYMVGGDENVPEVELPDDFFDLIDTAAGPRRGIMHFSYGFCTFNGNGQLLYHPFVFDNGPDYWVEGRRRIVEQDRMGLVNRLGQRVVPARDYTFIGPVRNGFAIGCRDCRYTVFDSADHEHGSGYAGTEYDVLDFHGEVVRSMHTPDPDKTLDSLAVRRQYRQPAMVGKLRTILMALPEIAEASARMSIAVDSSYCVCYDEPTPASPWYHFGYGETDAFGFGPAVQFLISPDGRKICYLSPGLDKVVPYAIWHRQPNKWD